MILTFRKKNKKHEVLRNTGSSSKVNWSTWYESDSPTEIEPRIFRTHGGRSIHWATRTHGEKSCVRVVMGSIPVGDSDFFFVPRWCHVDQFTFHISLPSLKFTIFILLITGSLFQNKACKIVTTKKTRTRVRKVKVSWSHSNPRAKGVCDRVNSFKLRDSKVVGDAWHFKVKNKVDISSSNYQELFLYRP